MECGFRVRGTFRDATKAWHLTALPGASELLTLHQADLLRDGSFDEVIDGCDYVAHCASPFFYSSGDEPDDQLLAPAVDGTMNVLESCAKASSVQRVVLTSSMAAVLYQQTPAGYVYDDSDWSDEALLREKRNWYMLSKTLAERAAWDFVAKDSTNFGMVSINPTLVTGPLLQPSMNTSTEIVWNYLSGLRKGAEIPKSTFQYVDVRDVADAHVGAVTAPGVEGKRYLTFAECVPVTDLVAALRDVAPSLAHLLPTDVAEGEQQTPILADATPALRELGLVHGYRNLHITLQDTVNALLASPFAGSLRA